MGAGYSTQPIKDRLKRALGRPWARAEKGSDSEPLQPDKLEVSVTRTITQETAPIIRAPSPLAPAETQLAVASGILGEPTPKQPFSGTPFTMPGMPPRCEMEEPLPSPSHNVQSPPEVSPMGDQGTVQPLVHQLGNITSSEPTSEHINMVVMSQMAIHPAANQPLYFPPLASAIRYESNPSACFFCSKTYHDHAEPRVYLPCGHSFGVTCLYRWIISGLFGITVEEIPYGQLRCPHNCIALHHYCGHLFTPYDSAPHPLHTDVSAFDIPSVYEFCRKGRGSRLYRYIRWLDSIEKALVGDPDCLIHRGEQRRVLDMLSLRRLPFSTKLLSMVTKEKLKAESDLRYEQGTWWHNEFAKRGALTI